MLISVMCPHCETTYQLQAELRGKHIKCPNPLCQEILIIPQGDTTPTPPPEQPSEQPAPTPSSQASGSVGDIVPLVPTPTGPAEEAAVPPRAPEQEKTPPAPLPTLPRARPDPAAVPSYKGPEQTEPIDLPAGMWKEPPVRKSQLDLDTPISTDTGTPIVDETSYKAPAVRQSPSVKDTGADGSLGDDTGADGSLTTSATSGDLVLAGPNVPWRGIAILGGLMMLVIAAVAGAMWLLQGKQADEEEQRRQMAQQLYEKNQFADAARIWSQLEKKFSGSDHLPEYKFFRQFALARQPLYTAQTDVDNLQRVLRQFQEFVRLYQGDPLLHENEGDVWQTMYKAAVFLSDWAEQKKDRRVLELARQTLNETATYKAPKAIASSAKLDQLREQLSTIEKQLQQGNRRLQLLTELANILADSPSDYVRRGKQLVARYARTQPRLAQDNEVVALLATLPVRHREAVRYRLVQRPPATTAVTKEPIRFYFANAIAKAGVANVTDTNVVLAAAEGVLYALDPKQGQVRWAKRVGLDSTALPVKLPATPVDRPRLLVVSCDQPALHLLEAESGRTLWSQLLPGACRGQPVVIGRRAFVACHKGGVQEIDIPSGQLVGTYSIQDPLTGWGARQPDTNLVCFPADRYSVYVLDIAQQKCVRIVYTEHPAGSLRGRPFFLGQAPDMPRLLLQQTDDLARTSLRLVSLEHDDAKDVNHILDGWSWFTPRHGSDEITLVTDAGKFFVVGVDSDQQAQFEQRFAHTFPAPSTRTLPMAAQVVHSRKDLFWVLAHGKLHKLQAGFFRDTGPKLFRPLLEPRVLGTPLQPSQMRATDSEAPVMVLATRLANNRHPVATALRGDYGQRVWQNSLGHFCRDVVTVGDKIISLDHDGAALVFDPKKFQARQGQKWYDAGLILANRFAAAANPQRLLSQSATQTVIALAGTNQDGPTTLHVRLIHLTQQKSVARQVTLAAPFQGTPAAGKDSLLFPLANGILSRLPLGGGPPEDGPNWRGTHADADSEGHLLWTGGNDFLFTDGSRGLISLRWPAGNTWEEKDRIQLPRRITRSPVLLRRDKSVHIVVADADQRVMLLQTEPLKTERTWQLPGRLTAGPFVRAGGFGCIVNDRTLYWFAPNQAEPVWSWSASAHIVGEPHVVAGKLIVADRMSRIAALDLVSGKEQNLGGPFLGSAVPTAAPVPWRDEHVLMPMTDGTMVLVPIK